MNKTLIGKDGFLFLQNDSSREIETHQNNISLVNNDSLNRYKEHKDKCLLTVFPDKSMVLRDFLPDGYNLIYRPNFDVYAEFFGERIIDGYAILQNEPDIFYKTDTHMNLNGCYIIYKHFIKKANELFGFNLSVENLHIEKNITSLVELNIGYGDLIRECNIGNQILENTDDLYFFNDDIHFYEKYVISHNDPIEFLYLQNNSFINKTNELSNRVVNWDIISNHILHIKNIPNPKCKVLILYDSFLLSTMKLYMKLFDEVYMFKNVFYEKCIHAINPDYIFEFRIERFLN